MRKATTMLAQTVTLHKRQKLTGEFCCYDGDADITALITECEQYMNQFAGDLLFSGAERIQGSLEQGS